MHLYIPGYVAGYEELGLIGDDFLTKASGHLMNQSAVQESVQEYEYFMKDNFQIKIFSGSSLELNKSIMGRTLNQLVNVIKERKKFPKVIVMVLDDDLLGYINQDEGISEILGQITHWLTAEITKIIENYKDKLPGKALHAGYPQIVWMAPPLNCNFNNNIARNKLGKSMKASIDIQPNHIILKLLKIWEYDNSSLFREGHFTPEGFCKYWLSVDSAVEFWHKHLAPTSRASQQQQMQTYQQHNKKLKSKGFVVDRNHHRDQGGYQQQQQHRFFKDKSKRHDCYHWTLHNNRFPRKY